MSPTLTARESLSSREIMPFSRPFGERTKDGHASGDRLFSTVSCRPRQETSADLLSRSQAHSPSEIHILITLVTMPTVGGDSDSLLDVLGKQSHSNTVPVCLAFCSGPTKSNIVVEPRQAEHDPADAEPYPQPVDPTRLPSAAPSD